ncbi:MAG: hypothetical protein ABIO43_00635, partial [Sphingomicrobium sp.]
IHLHVHLVEVPAPVPETAHLVDPPPADLACEKGAKPIPPQAHRLVADVDPAFEQQVLDVAQGEG